MEFHEKLQALRKQKGFTQEELAEILFVSRTAVSKWESGRGYPNIDSLKAIAACFSITVDELLSGDELLSLAEADTRQKEGHFRTLVFGLLDCSIAMLFFLPFFGQKFAGAILEVPLLSLTETSLWLKAVFVAVVIAIAVWGIATLALQNCRLPFWVQNRNKISLALNAVGVLLFTVSLQPYAAVFLFLFLIIKALMLIKWQ